MEYSALSNPAADSIVVQQTPTRTTRTIRDRVETRISPDLFVLSSSFGRAQSPSAAPLRAELKSKIEFGKEPTWVQISTQLAEDADRRIASSTFCTSSASAKLA